VHRLSSECVRRTHPVPLGGTRRRAAHVCVCVWVGVCVRCNGVRACVPETCGACVWGGICVHLCACAVVGCVRACVRACVHACVRACVLVACACVRILPGISALSGATPDTGGVLDGLLNVCVCVCACDLCEREKERSKREGVRQRARETELALTRYFRPQWRHAGHRRRVGRVVERLQSPQLVYLKP
jgi:hypothetical protein